MINLRARLLTLIATGALVAASLVALPSAAASAAVNPATNPHYFGPWPNWALSPLTSSKAKIQIQGAGTGASAEAVIDPVTGGVTQVNVVAAGSGYTSTTRVRITGGATAARLTPVVTTSGAVTGGTVGTPGSGYSAFAVALSGGGGTGGDLRAHGGVEAVHLSDGGQGYTAPTVAFDLPDLDSGVQARGHVATLAGDGVDGMDANGTITNIVIDNPGSGYLAAPGVAVINGDQFNPVNMTPGGHLAVGTTTMSLTGFDVVAFGSGYTSAPAMVITDPSGTGTGATGTPNTDAGALTGVTVVSPGSGYLDVGIRKFVDELPLFCDQSHGGCPTASGTRYLPIADPVERSYLNQNTGQQVASDVYEIGLVQYRRKFSADLPATLVRGYVQLDPQSGSIPGSQRVPLFNEMLDGTKVPVLVNGAQATGVTAPQWLGPVLGATKNRPVRVIFRNLLPTGAAGDLFLPVDSTMMGSGMGPMGMAEPADQQSVTDAVRNPECSASPKPASCFTDNRATIHLHGGITPWISDGTPHQWITPAGQTTDWPQGVSVENVPDMSDDNCNGTTDGCSTFYYTNQQSARLMFYHDHSWGETRLNVYAGESAGYFITDDTEKSLVSSGAIPGAGDTIPLFLQDKTFVPKDAQLFDTKKTTFLPDGTTKTEITNYGQDPTWDKSRWGGYGNFWYQHVYMPAQNPGDPSGASGYGRWFYGPWFYPPAADTQYGPIPNPYYDPNCKLDDPATWQYQTDPYCEPQQIPGTPNISNGMEMFNDTPIVNGVAYPKVTLDPKSYRMRILNAAGDRFWNLQWYVADPNQGNGKTEVALDPQKLEAAQTDPSTFATPVHSTVNKATGQTVQLDGPDWVQFANEGGFLPTPAVIDGQQPITWINDQTRFDFGNVDQHSLTVAPAERADVVVDFSKYAGKTLILYNDAPAAFPGRIPSYDYYTGGPDMGPIGAPKVLPGYGPNTRTIMQVTIAANTPAPAYDLTKLQRAFRHKADGSGVFESGQHPILVGQSTYNSTYGTQFAAGSDCNVPGATKQTCDGIVRINDTGDFGFNTLRQQSTRSSLKLDLKSIHDETNATTFDPFGRMQANLGLEKDPPTPSITNAILFPYVNPPTELIDGSQLPTTDTATPIAVTSDGTQIWRITHNGVDTHPIHFHLFDVQLLNRVTWDNIVIPNDPNENGWKDTVRVAPLEDTIVALRPITPTLPWEIPNSVRPLNPMMPLGDTSMFNSVDTNGDPLVNPISNQLVNFGWEYVWHCHIISHEEMDMMRPISYALPPKPAITLTRTVALNRNVIGFTDDSITETSFVLEKSTDDGATWAAVGAPIARPLGVANTTGEVLSLTDANTPADGPPVRYRVAALNKVGYDAIKAITVRSVSAELLVSGPAVAPAARQAPAAGTAGNAPTSAAPGAPTGVWAAAKASTTGAKTKQNITVHWALVQGAKRYVVQWSKDGTRVAGSASSRGTRASTPALARQTWKVRVAAISPGKKTVYSTWIDVPRV